MRSRQDNKDASLTKLNKKGNLIVIYIKNNYKILNFFERNCLKLYFKNCIYHFLILKIKKLLKWQNNNKIN